jgi:acetylornithine/succinyldiaminopimelate/putrescine aminotransferase
VRQEQGQQGCEPLQSSPAVRSALSHPLASAMPAAACCCKTMAALLGALQMLAAGTDWTTGNGVACSAGTASMDEMVHPLLLQHSSPFSSVMNRGERRVSLRSPFGDNFDVEVSIKALHTLVFRRLCA